MSWDGKVNVRELIHAMLARCLERRGILVEFKVSNFRSEGDNLLSEFIAFNNVDSILQAIENISKRIAHVVDSRKNYIATLTPVQFGANALSTIVTNLEEIK